MKQLLLNFTAPPAPDFDNFVIGANAEAVTVARAIAADGTGGVTYFWGAPGSGKSHLLRAMARAAQSSVYRHGEPFSADRLLLIDDIDRQDESILQPLFNRINAGGAAVVVTARSAPRDLTIRLDLATRLASGLTFQLHALSDAEKEAALTAHAAARGFELPPAIGRYLLNHAPRGMPALIAILDQCDRHSLETGRPVTLPLVREALEAGLKGAVSHA